MAGAGIGVRDTQAGHRVSAQRGDGVDRVPACHPGEAPGRLGAQIAGPLDDDGGIGVQDVPGRQERVVHADRLNVTAPGLPGRDGPGQPPGQAQGGNDTRVGQGQGPAVGHDVDDARLLQAVRGAQPGEHRRQTRVQVGHHHRHSLQVEAADRLGQQAVVGRALLVDTGDHHLVRHVAGLDEMPLARRVRRQDVQARADHGVPARTQSAVEGRDLQPHPLGGAGQPGEGLVGDRADPLAGQQAVRTIRGSDDLHVQLGAGSPRGSPCRPGPGHYAVAPHHGGRLSGRARHQPQATGFS